MIYKNSNVPVLTGKFGAFLFESWSLLLNGEKKCVYLLSSVKADRKIRYFERGFEGEPTKLSISLRYTSCFLWIIYYYSSTNVILYFLRIELCLTLPQIVSSAYCCFRRHITYRWWYLFRIVGAICPWYKTANVPVDVPITIGKAFNKNDCWMTLINADNNIDRFVLVASIYDILIVIFSIVLDPFNEANPAP